MAQIGTVKVQTQNSGAVSLPVYNLADFGRNVHDVVRVQTQNGGVGAIPFVAPADSDRPYVRVQTQNNGVLAAHSEADLIKLIDSFEDNDMVEYTINGSGSNTGVISSSNATDGSYVFRHENSGGNSSYFVSDQGGGLNYYPNQGDTWKEDILVAQNSTYGSFLWATQAGTYDGTNFPHSYIFQLAPYDNEIRLQRQDSNGKTDMDFTACSPDTGVFHNIDYRWDTNGYIEINAHIEEGGVVSTYTVSATDTTFTDGGIGGRVGDWDGNPTDCQHDNIYTT